MAQEAQQTDAEQFESQHELYMDEVAPSIWLGEKRAAYDAELETLKKHNICGIVSIGYYQEFWKFREKPKHLLLNIEDSPYVFITDYMNEVFKFIDDTLKVGQQAVLIHCEQGRSRSGAMVIAYLMKKYKQSYPETLNKVLLHRKRVMPNIGFQIQLRTFGKYGWNTQLAYSDKIDIDKELQTALKNLAHQVSRLQLDIRSSEKIFVTFDTKDLSKKRLVRIGLGNDDLSQYRKEWVLLVFLCHQFQLYKIHVHNSIITILHILGEMYFEDLVKTFIEVFQNNEPAVSNGIVASVAAAAAQQN
mmetsp:Transcript_42005/g.67528  ORF Transcript_42005/g.67528 Transcript_42005/m.67528 type:complete len:303 (-) Transcript_42005:2308-3216(-)